MTKLDQYNNIGFVGNDDLLDRRCISKEAKKSSTISLTKMGIYRWSVWACKPILFELWGLSSNWSFQSYASIPIETQLNMDPLHLHLAVAL